MVWVIVIAAVVVVAIVIGVLVTRARQRTQQIEQGREHREVAQRQEQEAKLRENIKRVMEADKETQGSLRECDMRIGFYEKEAAKLG